MFEILRVLLWIFWTLHMFIFPLAIHVDEMCLQQLFIKSYASVSVYFLARTLVTLWSGNSLHEADFQILSTCSLKVNMLSVATVKWSLQNNESHGWFERTFSWDRYWKFVNILWNSLLIISRWCSHLFSWLSCSRSP